MRDPEIPGGCQKNWKAQLKNTLMSLIAKIQPKLNEIKENTSENKH